MLVQVLDINDNNPEFVNFLPRVSVNENNTETEVFQLRAVDKDAGDFGMIEYSIESESDDFSVDTKVVGSKIKIFLIECLIKSCEHFCFFYSVLL